MKAHFYTFTGQVTPVALDLLVCLGVPASTVDALRVAFDVKVPEKETDAANLNRATRSNGGCRG